MNRSLKILLIIIAVIASAVCLLCCLFIFQYFRGSMLNDRLEEMTTPSDTMIVSPIPSGSTSSEVSGDTAVEEPDWAIDVDFSALAEINEEIYAWIDVPGTTISYAVVQSATNDLFYNNHGVDKAYYSGGSIYSQRYNSTGFQDPVTVLYGHNRQSKTMFAPVNYFSDQAFFEANRYIYIYTPETVYAYEIFAAYPHSSEHLLLNHDFSNEEAFSSYFSSLSDTIDSNYRRDLFPQFGDKVITLSTCYKSNRLQRYLVQGILTAEYPVIQQP